jgi:flagellar motility protein MotE (MotC chaperone)
MKASMNTMNQKSIMATLIKMTMLVSISLFTSNVFAQVSGSLPGQSNDEIETMTQAKIFRSANKQRLRVTEAKEELARRKERLGRLEQDVLRRYKALRMLQEELLSALKRSKREEEEGPTDSVSMAARNAARAQEVRKLAKSFESMKPAAAAQVIEVMEDELVVDVLRVVNPRKSGKIMSALNPKTAARVSELMTNTRRR